MPLLLKIVLIVVCVAAPAFFQYVVAPRLRNRPRLLLGRRKSTAIAALKDGEQAKITGVVAAREALLTSPVGGHACIGYQTSIDQKPSGGAGEVWLPAVGRTACGSFSVTDVSGTAVVDGPFRLELDVDDGAWSDLPPTVFSLLEEVGGPSALRSVRDGQTRFQEALLKPGDRVSVLGRATMDLDPGLKQIRGTAEEPVVIIDEDDLKTP